MGLLSRLLSKRRKRKSKGHHWAGRSEAAVQRFCAFETMEPRRMLSANPLVLGMVYIEEDLGSDQHGDRFELRFDGGAPETELVRLVINGDQNVAGFGVGDVFFDTVEGGLGADHAGPFQVEEMITARADARVAAHVVDGESLLTLDLYGFQAGDRLVFSIDVDEVEYFDPLETDLQWINDGFDPITSGVEFQGTQLLAEFAAPHYKDSTGSGVFWNRYDDALDASGLDLPADDIDGRRDRTTGGFLDSQQVIDPATISGYVFSDLSNDGLRDSGELGISNVTVQVIPVDTIDVQATVTLTTDANGYYEAANLTPGTYRVVELEQPSGYLDGLDSAGTVGAIPTGIADLPGDQITGIFLGGGSSGVEYNFGEILPASIEGTVRLSDADGNCYASGATTEPLPGVTLQLWDEHGSLIVTAQTDSAGHYAFTGLMPGVYSVIELTPSGLIDAGARAGHVDQTVRGRMVDANTIVEIDLAAADEGQEYDFCEHLPSTISGYVYHDRNDNAVRQTGEEAIGDVLVTLFDESGNQVAAQRTDVTGYYEFTGLSAGTYRLVEMQPGSWLDGQDSVGRVDGSLSGTADSPGDVIREVTLRWGSSGVEYNFGELLPGSIQGRVHAELDLDCELDLDIHEWVIEGVKVELLNAQGIVAAVTNTDANGEYWFDSLVPGMFTVRETQPDGYFQGNQKVGSHGGDATADDLIANIPVGSGQDLVDYNFCEIPPSSISGMVGLRTGPSCVSAVGKPLEDVTVELLNEDGAIVATARTAADGRYHFGQLKPGTYAVRETQPVEYFHGGQAVGSGGGDDNVPDLISTINVGAGVDLVDYNFCESPPASISGHVFQDGPTIGTIDGVMPENLALIRDGLRTPDDTPIPHVVMELRQGVTGLSISADQAIEGTYTDGPIRTVTDALGYYEFTGLPSGNYAVYEIHPESYIDGIDTPGTTSGLAVNPFNEISIGILQRLFVPPRNDAIILIPLAAGQSSQENNFSEVRVEQSLPPLPPPPPLPPVWNPVSIVLPPTIAWSVSPQMRPDDPAAIPVFGSAGALNMSWHLSVVNGGAPRNVDAELPGDIWRTVSFLDHTKWTSFVANDGHWNLPEELANLIGDGNEEIVFGIRDAIPISGDFNGDGVAEIGLFYQGHWLVDLNGNGRWDEQDLWALLGGKEDLPVVGDWDGDGKDDIGIFGPEWKGDERAITAEPGLPDPQNVNRPIPKNLPPEEGEATNGHRLLKRTANGKPRLDVIDHVFRFGGSRDVPVAGDWNGDGISSIGLFRDGTWHLDTDGDGRYTQRDVMAQFGQAGDVPVVGDFDGDGIDDLGIVRHGIWHLDANGDRVLDAHDRVFQMGDAEDTPVVGDFDGDGRDDPATYREAG